MGPPANGRALLEFSLVFGGPVSSPRAEACTSHTAIGSVPAREMTVPEPVYQVKARVAIILAGELVRALHLLAPVGSRRGEVARGVKAVFIHCDDQAVVVDRFAAVAAVIGSVVRPDDVQPRAEERTCRSATRF